MAKQLALAIALGLPVHHAFAEWLQYAETNLAAFYLETATVRSDNSFRTAWEIQSLKQREGNGTQSRMLLYEYECNLALFRILSVRVYSEVMADGRTIATDDAPGPWDYATSDTPVEKAIRIVCDDAAIRY